MNKNSQKDIKFELYTFQKHAIKWVLKKFNETSENRWFIIRSPTATGKTYIGLMSLYQIFQQSKYKEQPYFLTYTKIARIQAINKLKVLKQSGLINTEFFNIMSSNIVTIQSYKSNTQNILVVDEAHHLNPNASYKAHLANLNTKFLIGLTGTPRIDYEQTGFHPEIFGIKREDTGLDFPIIKKREVCLTEEEVEELRIKGDFYKHESDIDKCIGFMDSKDEKERKEDSKIRIITHIVCKYRKEFKKAIVFYPYNNGDVSKLIEKLQKKFPEENAILPIYGAEFKDKGNNKLQNVIDYFEKNKERTIIVGEKMLTEALDLPSVDALFFTGMTESDIQYSQMIGRGIRRSPNKRYLTIFDLRNNFETHHSSISDPNHLYSGCDNTSNLVDDNLLHKSEKLNIDFYRPFIDVHRLVLKMIDQLEYYGIYDLKNKRIREEVKLSPNQVEEFLALLCFEYEQNIHKLDEYYLAYQSDLAKYFNLTSGINREVISKHTSKPLEEKLVKYLIKPLMELKYDDSAYFERELVLNFDNEKKGRIDLMALGQKNIIFEFAIDDATKKLEQILKYKRAYKKQYKRDVSRCIIIGSHFKHDTSCRVIDSSNNVHFYNWTDFIIDFCDNEGVNIIDRDWLKKVG